MDLLAVVAEDCPAALLLLPEEWNELVAQAARWVPRGAPDLARVLLLRHLVTLGVMAEEGRLGSATSESLGPASASTGTATADLPPGEWGLTAWGALYFELVVCGGPAVL